MPAMQRDFINDQARKLDLTNEVRIEKGRSRIHFSVFVRPGYVETIFLDDREFEPESFNFMVAMKYILEHFDCGDALQWYKIEDADYFRKTPIDPDVFVLQQNHWEKIVNDCRKKCFAEWSKLDQMIKCRYMYDGKPEFITFEQLKSQEKKVEKNKKSLIAAVETLQGLSPDSIAAGVLMPESKGVT